MYERPEFVEVGEAEILTLGALGPDVDKCECCLPWGDDLPQPSGGGGS